MIRDTLRAGLFIAIMAIGSAILTETRFRLAAIDVAHRAALGQQIAHAQAYAIPASEPPPGRLRQFGRASIELADAALGILR
jgi:hypothetical protein